MNCDQVFDVLTRGPFPTGTACDMPVEAHLRVCPECRQLAEALRPALELFQEAIGPEESQDLPGYWCAVATDRAQPVVSYARELEPLRTHSGSQAAPRFTALSAWGLAAALALGVTLGSLASARWSLEGFSFVPPDTDGKLVSTDDESPRFSTAEHTILAGLPAACTGREPSPALRYSVTSRPLLASANLDNLHCCSECHNASSDSVSTYATATVSQSCRICHSSKSTASFE
jgi:hypothetical protein